jgi:hypothetical protein
MAAVYTNITSVTHNSVAIANVKSITVTQTKTPLEEQSDGARAPSIVGDLANGIEVSIEVSDTGALSTSHSPARLGFAYKSSLVFTTQLDSAPATVKTHTITNIVLLTSAFSSNQDNPNGYTISGRTAAPADTWSIA